MNTNVKCGIYLIRNLTNNNYANLYNTYTSNGYNIARAGEAWHIPTQDIEISCYDFTDKIIQTFASLHEAERAGYCRSPITCAIQQRNNSKTAYDMYWSYGHNPSITITKPKAGRHGGKTVYQYNLSYKYLNSYKSLADAERAIGKPGGNKNISAVCNGKRKSAYGFYWSYELKENME